MSEKPSPFELGRQHKLAGIPLGDKRCPYRTHSIEWVRYQNGRQSVNDEQAQRKRETFPPEHLTTPSTTDGGPRQITLTSAGTKEIV